MGRNGHDQFSEAAMDWKTMLTRVQVSRGQLCRFA